MRRALLVLVSVGCLLSFLALGPAVQARPSLQEVLPHPTCSLLHALKGEKLWRHYAWHIDKRDYKWICAVIEGESGWDPHAYNRSSGATGLVQFLAGWYDGRWWPYHFDATNPILSIRAMVVILRNPAKYGGRLNWRGY